MTASGLLLTVARRAPAVVRPMVWVWTRGVRTDAPHWLLKELHSRLGLSSTRKLRLSAGGSIHANPFDIIGQTIARTGTYEPDLQQLIGHLLSPGMVCIDAGAHIGLHTVAMASAVGPVGRVLAFEPTPDTFRVLKRNVRLHRLRNVVCKSYALSDTKGTARFHFGQEGPQNSLGTTVHASARSIAVETDTLDNLVERSNLSRVDFIKADVEGAELLLLRGAKRTLSRFRPRLMLEYSLHCSAFGYAREDISSFLQSLGYVLFRVGAEPLELLGSLDPAELYCNVVGVHADALDELTGAGVFSWRVGSVSAARQQTA